MRGDPVLRQRAVRLEHNGWMLKQATGGLHYIEGNGVPYFSLGTDTMVGASENGPWRYTDGDFGRDEAAQEWPELKPLLDLHLSDINGVPLHAKSNGWYWLAGATEGGFGQRFHGGNTSTAKTQKECLEIFAGYVRISIGEAESVLTCATNVAKNEGNKEAREWFNAWCDSQLPRWKQEADKVISDLSLVVYGKTQWRKAA